MPKLLRTTEPSDWDAIDNACRKLLVNPKLWTKQIDYNKVTYFIKNKNTNVHSTIIADTYMLIWQIGCPWYSSASFFEELLLVRIYKDGVGTMKDVHTAIDYLCASFNVAGAIIGTSLAKNDAATARMYKQGGFEQFAIGMYKESKDFKNERFK